MINSNLSWKLAPLQKFTINIPSFKSCIKQSVRSKVDCKMPWDKEGDGGKQVFGENLWMFFSRQDLCQYNWVRRVWSSLQRLVPEGQRFYRGHHWMPLPLHISGVQVDFFWKDKNDNLMIDLRHLRQLRNIKSWKSIKIKRAQQNRFYQNFDFPGLVTPKVRAWASLDCGSSLGLWLLL